LPSCKSLELSFAASKIRPAHSLPVCDVMKSLQADGQWHIPHSSSGTAMRTHATLQGSHMPVFTALIVSCERMETKCHLTSLASGRSALDPLQRSCGRKVRRVAGCRRLRPISTTLGPFLRIHPEGTLALTYTASLQVVYGKCTVPWSLGRPNGPRRLL
jgi:hypothetical protein